MLQIIEITHPRSLKCLLQNLEVEEEGRIQEVMTSDEMVTIVSDGGLKAESGFGWVAARDDEILEICHGEVKGSLNQMSSYPTEAPVQLLISTAKEM